MFPIRFRVRRGGVDVLATTLNASLISIGSASTAKLRLHGDGVDRIHAVIDHGELVDLGTPGGTRVNGEDVERRRLVSGDRIAIGDLDVEVRFGEEHALEAQLLSAIEDGDDASRIVYADWLEEYGDTARAELLRLQEDLVAIPQHDVRRYELESRLHELTQMVDRDWLARIARPQLWLGMPELLPSSSRKPADWDLPDQLRYLYATPSRAQPEPLQPQPVKLRARTGAWWIDAIDEVIDKLTS